MEVDELRKEMEKERREYNELLSLLVNIQKDYTRSNKMKDVIIVVLIVAMLIEACVGYCGFVWYESQFETVTTEEVELYNEGEGASAEYNKVDGNQYNDSSVHNEN